MAVKIRLTRRGRKSRPTYRIVVTDSRTPRSGKPVATLGTFDPHRDPPDLRVDAARARAWLGQRVAISPRAKRLLERAGVSV